MHHSTTLSDINAWVTQINVRRPTTSGTIVGAASTGTAQEPSGFLSWSDAHNGGFQILDSAASGSGPVTAVPATRPLAGPTSIPLAAPAVHLTLYVMLRLATNAKQPEATPRGRDLFANLWVPTFDEKNRCGSGLIFFTVNYLFIILMN